MSDPLTKKAGSKVQDLARKIAKQADWEKSEFLRSAKTQVSGTPDIARPSVVDEIVKQDGGTGSVSEQELAARSRKRLKELEDELAKLRQERTQKEAQWSQGQEAVMATPQAEEQAPLVMPTSKAKRGMAGGAAQRKKKQGTREIGRRPSG